eukprot:395610-Prorocentrum_minimum.AAC.1
MAATSGGLGDGGAACVWRDALPPSAPGLHPAGPEGGLVSERAASPHPAERAGLEPGHVQPEARRAVRPDHVEAVHAAQQHHGGEPGHHARARQPALRGGLRGLI